MSIDENFKMRNVLYGLDLDKPIYKYFKLKHLLTMLNKNELYVGKVKEWDDVYENFLLKQDFIYGNSHLSADNLIDQVYGQCWTSLSESDAMWRIYSKNETRNEVAIKLKTTARKLFDSIYTDDSCMATTYIGNVEYLYKSQILPWIKARNIHGAQDLGNSIVPSLFIKRKPFLHEKEVRIIIMQPYDMGSGLKFPITPETMFDEFVIDPRLDTKTVNKIAKRLINLGVNVNKIKQSQLYTFTPSTIRL